MNNIVKLLYNGGNILKRNLPKGSSTSELLITLFCCGVALADESGKTVFNRYGKAWPIQPNYSYFCNK